MRARQPDQADYVERDGVRLGYEVYGDGPTTVLLLPTWTIVHSRFWKMQIPYLARTHRVITYDGPGNGRSERVVDPARYAADAYAADAAAVLDACHADRAIAVGLSLGAQYAIRLTSLHPSRVGGVVLVGPALPLGPIAPGREAIVERFLLPYPEDPSGWDKYNVAYWHDNYRDFAQFFFSQVYSEPHSTKPTEDAVAWALEGGPDVLEADARRPRHPQEAWATMLGDIACPVLVVHGSGDRIHNVEAGIEAARLAGGSLTVLEGSGHMPNVRDPVRFNHAISEFVDRTTTGDTSEPLRTQVWTRALERPKKVLYVSSPIGLGHVRRDLAIASELRRARPAISIEWLAQEPVTTVLADAGEEIHPASEWLASESAHIASEATGHDLHCFQALRRMDEIMVANFMVFQEVVDEGDYDLVVGDEAWDVDYYWHENPELKRGANVWFTDFVGYLPMTEGGSHEAFLTTDYNAEMISHVERFPWIRDRALFVGNPDDIVPETFGSDLPKIRDWTEDHFGFTGYITGFQPPDPDQASHWRSRLGYSEDEKVCVVTVGGSGVGRDLLEKAIAAFPHAKEAMPELRMVAVAGPRIDPDSLPHHPDLEVRGYVDSLYRHLAVCDLAVVQGGLTTTMELTAAKRPFIYFPLLRHFEQNHHVRHRLDQYRAGRHMDYAATSPEALAAAIVTETGRPVDYREVETDGARRAATLIAELV